MTASGANINHSLSPIPEDGEDDDNSRIPNPVLNDNDTIITMPAAVSSVQGKNAKVKKIVDHLVTGVAQEALNFVSSRKESTLSSVITGVTTVKKKKKKNSRSVDSRSVTSEKTSTSTKKGKREGQNKVKSQIRDKEKLENNNEVEESGFSTRRDLTETGSTSVVCGVRKPGLGWSCVVS